MHARPLQKYANQAGKGVIEREDMEKAFPPVFSNLNLVVVAGNGPVEYASCLHI